MSEIFFLKIPGIQLFSVEIPGNILENPSKIPNSQLFFPGNQSENCESSTVFPWKTRENSRKLEGFLLKIHGNQVFP